jgi:hypothetical protein
LVSASSGKGGKYFYNYSRNVSAISFWQNAKHLSNWLPVFWATIVMNQWCHISFKINYNLNKNIKLKSGYFDSMNELLHARPTGFATGICPIFLPHDIDIWYNYLLIIHLCYFVKFSTPMILIEDIDLNVEVEVQHRHH